MQEPPQTFEEFLHYEKKETWPLVIEESLEVAEDLAVCSSCDAVAGQLRRNAPFDEATITSIEQRVIELSSKVHVLASNTIICASKAEKKGFPKEKACSNVATISKTNLKI